MSDSTAELVTLMRSMNAKLDKLDERLRALEQVQTETPTKTKTAQAPKTFADEFGALFKNDLLIKHVVNTNDGAEDVWTANWSADKKVFVRTDDDGNIVANYETPSDFGSAHLKALKEAKQYDPKACKAALRVVERGADATGKDTAGDFPPHFPSETTRGLRQRRHDTGDGSALDESQPESEEDDNPDNFLCDNPDNFCHRALKLCLILIAMFAVLAVTFMATYVGVAVPTYAIIWWAGPAVGKGDTTPA